MNEDYDRQRANDHLETDMRVYFWFVAGMVVILGVTGACGGWF